MANPALLNRAMKGMAEVPFTGGNQEFHPKPSFGGMFQYSKYDVAKFVQTAFDGDLVLLEKMLDREDPIEGFHHDFNQHYGEYNALHMAAANGQIEAVELLLKAGADPHVKRCMPLGQEPEDGETARDIAEKWGYDDIVEILKSAESKYPKGLYMRYGVNNNAKLWPMDRPEGLDAEQEKRAKAKLKGLVRPLPATKADFKFYGDAVFGYTHGYNDDGIVLKNKIVTNAGVDAQALQDTPKPTTCALLFPGQGSQYLKMMSGAEANPRVKEMLIYAKSVLGYDLMEVCLNGPEEKLESTEICLPAMYVASLVAVETLRARKPEAVERPGAVAGLSIGEFTALTVAGVMNFEDGLKLVKIRAEALAAAAKASPQAMISIAGLEKTKVQELCKDVAAKTKQICQIANELFPKGFTCSGGKAAIEELMDLANKNGALQSKMLKTNGAFHTPCMEPARVKLEKALKDLLPKLKPPRCDIYLNATGSVFRAGSNPKDLIPLLCDQMVSPVKWDTSVKAMIASGMTEFHECGPMKQLKAMMKRIDQGMWANTLNVEC
jgi:[acyl-carrier-protein] S-malonyltransferase